MTLADVRNELDTSRAALTEALEVVQAAHDGSGEDYQILLEALLTAWNAVRRAKVDLEMYEKPDGAT
jgi:hypothetical protein